MLTGMDGERAPIALQPGEEAIARMPSPAERRRLNLEAGVPVIEIRRTGTVVEVLPALNVYLHVT